MKKSGNSGKTPNLWKKFKSYTIVYNLFIIIVLALVLAGTTFVAMSVGTRHNARRTVPDFIGQQFAEAEQCADNNDLEIIINDSIYVANIPGGVVLDQLPKGGVVVKPGRKVYVTINNAHQRIVDVPYVAGRSLRQAKNMLEMVGLTIDRIVYVRDLATNYVIDEYVNNEKVTEETKIRAEKGTGVVLHVGVAEDAQPVIAPVVVGFSLNDAKSRLWEMGLNVGKVSYDEGIPSLERKNAKVYSQSVTPGRSIGYGGVISLQLTIDEEKVNKAMAEQAVRVLDVSLEADSLTSVQHQRLLDSLENLGVVQSQEILPAQPQTDSQH
jgi:beta-lactam-binding protein with PASTA domain